VRAPRATVFAFLSRLENHWQLAGRWIEVVTLERSEPDLAAPDGGRVRICGPLGIRRTALTRVESVEAPSRLEGVAIVGRTRARVRWALHERAESTEVVLTATILRAGLLDRVLLAVGGRAWMRGRLRTTLAHLDERVAVAERPPEALSASSPPAPPPAP
jgi:hypothetical protein